MKTLLCIILSALALNSMAAGPPTNSPAYKKMIERRAAAKAPQAPKSITITLPTAVVTVTATGTNALNPGDVRRLLMQASRKQ